MSPGLLPAAVAGLATRVDDLTRDSASAAARQELSKAIYHRDDPTPTARALRWVLDTLGRWLDAAVAASPGGVAGALVLVTLVAGAVVALRLRTRWVGSGARGHPGPRGDGEPRAADYRHEADTHAAAGRWAAAVRARLRALVRELEDRGVLDPRPGATADEVAEAAALALPALAADLRGGARLFDEVWYGGRRATAADDRTLRDLDERVRRRQPGAPG
ncbi:MAG TPA: DUF4129 domain-containing protein [Mycobacteriales bacterium]|nr:DUF4129 domain-containing protein [Mycobacteriales bacterium]